MPLVCFYDGKICFHHQLCQVLSLCVLGCVGSCGISEFEKPPAPAASHALSCTEKSPGVLIGEALYVTCFYSFAAFKIFSHSVHELFSL